MSGSGGGLFPRLLITLAKTAAVFVGGTFTLGVVSSAAVQIISAVNPSILRPKNGLACGICKGKGFYACKLCKGTSTIEWSPLYDPVIINPCICPTCDGKRIQRCLNCLGNRYIKE